MCAQEVELNKEEPPNTEESLLPEQSPEEVRSEKEQDAATTKGPTQESREQGAKSSEKSTAQTTTSKEAKPKQTKKKSNETQSKTKAESTSKTKQASAESIQPAPPKFDYVSQAELDSELAKLKKLSDRALAGDTTALDKLRAALEKCPHIWRRLADLQPVIEEKMAALVAGKHPLQLEAFRKRASDLRCRLQTDSDAPYVKMAISRVVASWLFAQLLEWIALESRDVEYFAKQAVTAERKFQIAMQTFAQTKQLEQQLAAK